MRVRFTARALRDLNRINAYILSESPSGAARIGARIRKRANDLAQFPFQGTKSQRQDLFQLYVSQTPYMLIYRVRADEVQIVTIVHTSQRRRS